MRLPVSNSRIVPASLLTRGLFSVLTVFIFTVFASAEAVVVRTNGGTQTATGTDVSTVQKAAGYASGDVINVSGTSATNLAPFSASVRVEGTAYTVDNFTVQSGTSGKQYIGGLADGRNYVLKLGNKNYNLTFKDVEFQNTGVAQNTSGIFLIMDQGTSTLTLNLDNASFTKFQGSGDSNYGGVINSSGDLTINGTNTVSFYGNGTGSGGAIFANKSVTIDCDEILFDSNACNNSGAIRNSGALDIQGSKVTFSNNSARNSGGSIYSSSTVNISGKGGNAELTFSGNSANSYGGVVYATNTVTMSGTGNDVFTFTGNSANDEGGVIYSSKGIEINSKTINFSSNTAKNYGGAIRLNSSSDKVLITGETVTFDKNTALNKNGGAIHTNGNVELKGKSQNSVFTFSNNSAPNGNSGVMVVVGTVDISTGTFNFQNNSVKGIGGAIEARAGITFSGDNTSATFTGNIAGTNGDDIFLSNSTVLTFKDSGTYSFDGGIYLDSANGRTVIDEAQVTIAGRQYKPVANEGDPLVADTTNNYQLRNVTISNGGKLTANLDYIDSLAGIFNLTGTGETAGTLELNVGEDATKSLTLSSSFKIAASTGNVLKTGAGTLQINAPEGTFNAQDLTVSEGRLDFLGKTSGGITVEGGTFSPGNSVGTADLGGTFTLKEGATLLIEQDVSGIDQIIATNFSIEPGAAIDLEMGSVQPGRSYAILQHQNPSEVFSEDISVWESLLTSSAAYYWNLSYNDEQNTVFATLDANAVPEPATWVMLLIGSFGLMYWRKKFGVR